MARTTAPEFHPALPWADDETIAFGPGARAGHAIRDWAHSDDEPGDAASHANGHHGVPFVPPAHTGTPPSIALIDVLATQDGAPPPTPGTEDPGPHAAPWQFGSDLDLLLGGGMDAKGGAKPGGGGSGGGGSGGGGDTGLLTTYISGDAAVDDANEFNILINFSGTWTAQQQAIVTWAADTLSNIIVGDVRDDTDLSGNFVDDIVIDFSTGRIDGSGNPLFGNTLAQTQITAVRDPGSIDEWLPVTASIKLDSSDLKNAATNGWSSSWDAIVLHEMAHALGFAGVVFDGLGLVDGAGNFTGANAVASYGGTLVPIEDGGGSGTAGSHWDEATFAPDGTPMPNDLMTGYIGQNEQTLISDTTIAAFADLGYTTFDPSAATSFLVDSGLILA